MNVHPERSDVDRLRQLTVIVGTGREKIGVVVINPDLAQGNDGPQA